MNLDANAILYLALGAMAGGFVNGFAGTGTALFAMGFFLSVLDPLQAVAIVAFLSVLAGLQGLWVVRANIRAAPGRIVAFVLPGLIGVPLGIVLLSMINATTLRFLIAAILIIYGGYFSFRAALPKFDRVTPVYDTIIAFVGGVLGGTSSISGALPSIWLSMRPWPKAQTRALLQPYNVCVLATIVVILGWQGAYAGTLSVFAVVLPVGLVSAQIGIETFKRVSDDTFRRMLIVLCLLMGLGIVAPEVWRLVMPG